MPSLFIEIWDAAGGKRQKVEVPADAPLHRLITTLVNRMGLPRQGSNGQPLSYKAYRPTEDRPLLDTQSLADAGIKDGDVLQLRVDASARDEGRIAPTDTRPCPSCGEQILVIAKKCRYCGDFIDAMIRPPTGETDATLSYVVPVGRPASAIAAGYLGLVSFFPFVGVFTGALAVVFGILALKQIKRNPKLLGNVRAWFGILFGGGLAALQLIAVLAAMISSAVK